MTSPNTSNDLSSKFALDVKDMGSLRQSAKAGSPEALKTAATQFEAMFVNMMMKSMREATPQDGMMDSQQTKMFTTMLDQQTSQNIAKKGIGLSDMLIRQLSKTADKQALAIGNEAGDTGSGANGGSFGGLASLMDAKLQRAIAAAGGAGAVGAAGSVDDNSAVPATVKGSQAAHVRSFQQKLGADAEEASRATGIPAKFMLGQAALESGWGKREIKGRDGSNSHNLFGIKAGGDWKGKVVEATTTEYVNGKAQTKVERFRAYDSYSDSFKDYAKLLASNPRYEKVLASAGDASSFAHGLQKAGYATDPNYANKLTSIIKRSLAG
ncbi:flagellar assembly peptidoglycan hydrolase FlgJ [Duganella sp. BJB488]|uniref:flagellar assembly peptidoglycan hydrolase FlgJ n=1 Tax=unclassified Duganella TaxID=2636909 RepID=UPI000E34463C|nr:MULTISPECIES: flagellar assembly peptidoglycan hydrolase FlgJ [unclassified Duganella]NVD73844.1 flagellar assembly peptidoglycan hydrolase FlgJ [Duganella sp. BJB1802]RFP25892.1 flagellar assembly peptidoglycan hydrolase FlgJ [Duganella sp. BJB489]RFP28367.1 flagellar assembly peptidoglycan hydrolase FlgJ [Duganella sp. BJB488]RFP36822.1 flagellar assembly peptidoglycan hydrolase FlgJ [Duganella sp. BJB480]